jgi:hypothetical protein
MTFEEAHNIWRRVVTGDKTLTIDKVKAAAQWFDDFIALLNDKASQSKQELEEAIQTREQVSIEKKTKATETDERQLDGFIRKHDDLINWLKLQV